MTQAELAERMGRPTKTINEIIKGKAAITPETALQFERVFRVPAHFWNNREQRYREYLAAREEDERLKKAVEWLKELPVAAMIKLGWVRRQESRAEQVRELLNFFGVVSPECWQEIYCGPQVAYRKSPAFQSHPAAIAAWLRRGEIEAREITCSPYAAERFKKTLPDLRALTVRDPALFQTEMVRLCALCGVAVTFVPELPGTRLCGAARWLNPDTALIQLSLRHKTDDHLWFAFFHEVAHILLHGKRACFVDFQDQIAVEEQEQEANRFAADLLIPPAALRRFKATTPRMSATAIEVFASKVGIAPGIVVGRLQHEHVLPRTHCNRLKRRFEFVARASRPAKAQEAIELE
jgi:plasmid maintenance system antidote protein VapI